MDKMIGFCGIICTECPAFLATQKDDDKERERVAKLWSGEFNAKIKPDDINCDGCLEEAGRLFSHCKVCKIRKCGLEKGVTNCAYCDDFICEKLDEFLKMVPEAKQTLEEIKKGL